MRPFKSRSDDWIFGALLAAVLGSAVGLNGAWVHEARDARAASAVPSASALAQVPPASRARSVTPPLLTAAAPRDLP
jgi:hypothetical protein